MKISVIIPIYNEKNTIVSLLKRLECIKDDCEILLVDGGSSDGTLELIPKEFTVLSSPKGRANQMNYGAKVSSGDVLFFLHCDSVIPPSALEEIEEVMQNHNFGCFGIAFNTKNFFMKCCQFLSNNRIKMWKIVFGDQGIFLKRDLFFQIGGFPNLPIMEDYQFSLNLRQQKEKIGMTKSRIYTSDRRFKSGGPLRTMWKMYNLRRLYRKGEDINKIAAMYRDIR